MSDWFASGTTSGASCLRAGLNLEMPGRAPAPAFQAETGYARAPAEEEVDAASGLLRVWLRTSRCRPSARQAQYAKHQQLARCMASRVLPCSATGADLLVGQNRIRRLACSGRALPALCRPLYGGSAGYGHLK
jgi:hypothetical protein